VNDINADLAQTATATSRADSKENSDDEKFDADCNFKAEVQKAFQKTLGFNPLQKEDHRK